MKTSHMEIILSYEIRKYQMTKIKWNIIVISTVGGNHLLKRNPSFILWVKAQIKLCVTL